MTDAKKIAVVGGGVSGIASSYFLIKKGYNVVLFEKNNYLGGRMSMQPLNNRLVAIGGKNIIGSTGLFRDFVKNNGDSPFESHGIRAGREINGKILSMDFSSLTGILKNVIAGGVTDFVKFGGYAKKFSEVEGGDNYFGHNELKKLSEKFDNDPLSTLFGPKFCENFLRVLTVRMTGAEPCDSYMASLCAIFEAVKASKTIDQLSGDGIQRVIDNFSETPGLTIRLNTMVASTTIKKGKSVCLAVTSQKSEQFESFDGVVVATPAHVAGDMLGVIDSSLKVELKKINYNPIALAVVDYKRKIFSLNQGGVSFGSSEKLFNAAAYGKLDLQTARYTFSGAKAMELIDQNSDPEELVDHAEKTLNRFIPVSYKERKGFTYNYFAYGHCSFAPYHHNIIQKTETTLENIPIVLAGDYIKGPSIEACFVSGEDAARKLDEKLKGERSFIKQRQADA